MIWNDLYTSIPALFTLFQRIAIQSTFPIQRNKHPTIAERDSGNHPEFKLRNTTPHNLPAKGDENRFTSCYKLESARIALDGADCVGTIQPWWGLDLPDSSACISISMHCNRSLFTLFFQFTGSAATEVDKVSARKMGKWSVSCVILQVVRSNISK